MADFLSRNALVTGGTSGIGLAVVERLARAGTHVFVNSEDAAACASVADRLVSRGLKASAAPCDVSDPVALRAMAASILTTAGTLEVLVCNAGVPGPAGPSAEVSDEAVERTFAINLEHPRRLCQVVVPAMAAAGGGAVVLTSSIAGLRGNKALGVYAMTKAALAQLARNLAVEFGPAGVRVNAVSPGLIATGWETAILSNPAAAERRMSLTPLRRVGQPSEVAAAICFLASSEASFITGHNLVVDGGTMISD